MVAIVRNGSYNVGVRSTRGISLPFLSFVEALSAP